MNVVELMGVGKRIEEGGEARWILENIDLSAERGELVLIMGPSGSGKTSLLTLMAGFIRPSAGRVALFGADLSGMDDASLQALRARRIGFVFQNFLLIDSFTGYQNAELPLRFAGHGRREAERIARESFANLGIQALGERRASGMSHGERQRVALARALCGGPQLVLADEPTANLRSDQGMLVIETLHAYVRERGATAIVATHDARLEALADRCVCLKDGRLAG
jgi:putative ABC transport system ATP-binding protein